jgi:hypothetical protein
MVPEKKTRMILSSFILITIFGISIGILNQLNKSKQTSTCETKRQFNTTDSLQTPAAGKLSQNIKQALSDLLQLGAAKREQFI